MLSFHILVGEISITLNNVSCILHLPIQGKLFNYSRTTRPEALDRMVTYLGADRGKAQQELDDTRWCHARFSFLIDLHEHHLDASVEADGGDSRVAYHKACALRLYLLVLAEMSIFTDKIATYVNVIYLRYFINLERICKYNYRVSYLVYLYSKLAKDSIWKTWQLTGNNCLLQ